MAASKEEWYNRRIKEGFFIFDKGEFPALTDTSYDPLVFTLVNSAYSSNPSRFFEILEPHIYFDNQKKDFKIDSRNIDQLKKDISSDMPLKGLQIFEMESKEAGHLEFFRSLGAEIDSNSSTKINEFNGGRITLNNYQNTFKYKQFDITLSNGLLNNDSYIKYNNMSGNLCGLELYAIFANLTKKGGCSIHINGSMITSLFITFFQLVGMQTIEYSRHSDGDIKFMIIMKKINNKLTSYEEFSTIYAELKKRNPIRYI